MMENQKSLNKDILVPYFINALNLSIIIYLFGKFPIPNIGTLFLHLFLIIIYSLIGAIIFSYIANFGYFNPWIAKTRYKESSGEISDKLIAISYQFSKYFIPFWPALYTVENSIEKDHSDLEHHGLLTELFGSWSPSVIK